ncbi:MAG: hypothetical protein PCFJNLEI_03836 [Verrucomicrobiae bacterium]|nr:hypothetical protein [Verrucomicrobiae bacterium]
MNTAQNLIAEAQPLPLETTADGTIRFRFKAFPGLCQFSVVADAREFNWDELYTVLNDWHGINGERTGPWDFHLFEQSRPLVPSYWVTINGKKIGLWFFQRVSIEDIAAKRFRGRMAFYVPNASETVVELQPYRPVQIRWLAATLERDPEDRLDLMPDVRGIGPAAQWADTGFWEKRRQELATTHAMYREPLQRAFEWILKSAYQPSHVLMLTAAYRMENNAAYREKLFTVLDEAIARPHWGNPKEDGYSHNGDMGAAASLFALAWAWHALSAELGDERRAKLKAKLALQGDRFFHLTLLNRDYWGGSVMQDHGRISIPLFGVAALHLLGVVPDAPLWVQYIIPRVRRAVHAMPRDGVIPISSYCNLPSYLDHQTWFRDTLLALTGQDLFDEGPFLPVIDYINATLRPEDFVTIIDMGPLPFLGGNAFLNRMATKYGDARAAFLQAVAVKSPPIKFSHPVQEEAFYNGALWGFLSYDPRVPPVAELPAAKPLAFFQDSGLAYHRNPQKDVTFAVRCGPWLGYHAYRHAQGPCDRMGMGVAPGPGHFTIARGHTYLLTTPDTGYKLRATVKSCLLVDGGGQYDDVGYPMSIPSKRDRGEEIQFAKWDDATQTGWVRLNLAPAYRDELQMAVYYRDFLIHPDRLICRDQVVLNDPHQLAWLFQGNRETGIELVGAVCRFGKDAPIDLTARPAGFELQARIQQTPVVWSYSSGSGFKPFDHVRYEATQPLHTATVEFVFKW